MKGYANWNYKPYIPAIRLDDEAGKPYICRIAPGERHIEVEWIGECEGSAVYYAPLEGGDWMKLAVSSVKGDSVNIFVIKELEENADYQFYVETVAGKTKTRLARTGFVPGTVVNYLHPLDEAYLFSGSYLCSPSIVLLPNGKLITSMDVYRSKFPQNLTILCESLDGGETWHYLSELFPCFWGKLFWHNDVLYMLSTSTEYGDLLIGRSDDEGKTWGLPTVLMRGSCSREENGFHKAPVTLIHTAGRLWSAVEYGSWPKLEYKNTVLSIDENADLLKAENWEFTPFLKHDPNWPGCYDVRAGAIEGNAVESPDGKIVNMLRYGQEMALQLVLDPEYPEGPLRFLRVAEFPMGHTKFEVQKIGDMYVAVGNRLPKRNILSVYISKDLTDWQFAMDIINHEELDMNAVGFQYPVFTFDPKTETLLVLSRTAFNNAHNFHDSNYQTFHKIPLAAVLQKGSPAGE
jgi:hypothetical protein